MKNNYRFFSTLFLSISLFLVGFSAFAQQQYVNGILILNEGMSGTDSATVSFLPDGGTIQNNIFATANPGGTLGDTGQSLSFHEDKAYIILNLSNRLRVVDRTTFQLEATLNTGLSNPRYMAFANGKGYITCWGGSTAYVAVLNLESNTIETTIEVEAGVERIIEVNGKLYAAHKGGAGYGNTISVIDPVTDTLETTITVGDVPNTMVVDNGFLYVLCEGKPSWTGPQQTFGKLVKINLADNTVVSTLDFPLLNPSNLKLANGNFYYSVLGKVFKMAITDTELPTEPLFTLTAPQLYGIYGMEIIDETLYVTEVTSFTAAAKVNLYSLDGTFIQFFTAGVSTNSYYKALEVDLGIGDNKKLELALYPNPTTNVFYINTKEEATVTMYDLSGRLIATQNYTPAGINVAHLSKGVYVVETQIGNNKNVQKLIVK